jgi:multiple sugar transport system permease protein
MKQRMGPAHWVGFVIILVWCLLPVVWIAMVSL